MEAPHALGPGHRPPFAQDPSLVVCASVCGPSPAPHLPPPELMADPHPVHFGISIRMPESGPVRAPSRTHLFHSLSAAESRPALASSVPPPLWLACWQAQRQTSNDVGRGLTAPSWRPVLRWPNAALRPASPALPSPPGACTPSTYSLLCLPTCAAGVLLPGCCCCLAEPGRWPGASASTRMCWCIVTVLCGLVVCSSRLSVHQHASILPAWHAARTIR